MSKVKIKESEVQVDQQTDLDIELNKFNTMSAKIRYLNSKNMSRGAISKKLNIRYQWVRNVLITEVAKPKENINN